MATRRLRFEPDEILRKKSKEVDVVDKKITRLLKDMAETMYKNDGVGLAAPQVGILKRVIVIDAGEGLIELVNPVITEKSGEQQEVEGCLSIPGVFGEVKRPVKTTVKALNGKGEEITVKGEKLLSVALNHEIDHLNGVLFIDKVERYVSIDELRRKNKRK
jgi:peptide deformylase